MVDIQSLTAENRRGKKEEEERRRKKKKDRNHSMQNIIVNKRMQANEYTRTCNCST